MRLHRLLNLLLFLVALPVLGAKIHLDYDGAAVFSEYRTFQFRNSRHDLRRVSPALHEKVARQLIYHARAGGLAMVPSEPELYLVYYVAYRDELRLVREGLRYGYGDSFTPGSFWQGGNGTHDAGESSFTFEKGTVVIDLWDRQRAILIWRGIAPGVLKKGFEGNEARLGKALERLMKRWDEMYGTTPR
jgi:hypothetical protein